MSENRSDDNIVPIDLESVLERTGGDRDFLIELLDLYVQEFPSQIAQIKNAAAEGNFIQIRDIGHSLKGASANLSLTQLQDSSFNMERAGREENLALAEESLLSLEKEFEILKEFIEKYKKG